MVDKAHDIGNPPPSWGPGWVETWSGLPGHVRFQIWEREAAIKRLAEDKQHLRQQLQIAGLKLPPKRVDPDVLEAIGYPVEKDNG